MSIHWTGSDECDRYDDDARRAAEADAERDRLVTDYMAAREAVRRIHHRMSRDEVWAVKDRFYRAQLELQGRREDDAYRAMQARHDAAQGAR